MREHILVRESFRNTTRRYVTRDLMLSVYANNRAVWLMVYDALGMVEAARFPSQNDHWWRGRLGTFTWLPVRPRSTRLYDHTVRITEMLQEEVPHNNRVPVEEVLARLHVLRSEIF